MIPHPFRAAAGIAYALALGSASLHYVGSRGKRIQIPVIVSGTLLGLVAYGARSLWLRSFSPIR